MGVDPQQDEVEYKETQELQQEDYFREPVKNWPQYVAAVAVTIFLLISGTVLGWTSPTLPILKLERGITENEEKWISSLMPLGAMVGPFPGGISADYFGRKKSMMGAVLMILVSWCILSVAHSIIYFYAGRILVGFAIGWGMTVMPMYIGEIATPNLRGALGVLGQIQICLGFLYVYSFGPFISYTWLCFACGILPGIFFICFIFAPETPHFFLLQDDIDGAMKSLQWLRRQSERGVKRELALLQSEVEKSLETKGTWRDTFLLDGNRKAILIILGLMTLQQFSGINVVLFYSESIFTKAGSKLSPSMCTILVGVVMTVASLVVPYFIEKLGRRLVTIISAVGMTISLAGLGVYFYLEYVKYDTANLTWLPLTAVISYICTYSFGAGPVPWMMISEVFAPNIRAKGAAFSSSSSWALAFVMTNFFPTVEVAIGSHGAFGFFSMSCAVGAVLVYLFLPETKGKTLQEIQDMLNEK